MPLPKLPFVVLDTETTGLIPRSDRVVELALQRFENGEKVAEAEFLFAVDIKMSPVARILTRLKEEDMFGKPSFADVQGKIEPLLTGAVLIGQNLGFDISMLKGEGMDLSDRPWIDSAMLASIVLPEAHSFSLGYLSALLHLPHEPKHRAMGDVRATAALVEFAWDRLSFLPAEIIEKLKTFAEKGPEGHATFFAELKGKKGKEKPEWLKSPLKKYHTDAVTPQKGTTTWLAVKNLETTIREEDIGDLHAVFAPQFLLDPRAEKSLLAQEELTAGEMTLAMKLLLYAPARQVEFPLHGDEYDVWKGKLACTRESPAYGKQFEGKGALLLDHRQLFELLVKEHEHAPKPGEAVSILDASMLEDTATKAFTWTCATDPLRAAAVGDEKLTRFLDAFQMFIERVRTGQDLRYLVEADLTSREAKGLLERIASLLDDPRTEQVVAHLEGLQNILNPKNLAGRVSYIEQFRDGGQSVCSAPLDIASLLKKLLYDQCPTTLHLPPGNIIDYGAIMPAGAPVTVITEELPAKPALRLGAPELPLERLLPRVDGRVICLVPSKREIERLAVLFMEPLEKEGITLIAQGLSGGLGRMEAEFETAGDRAVWMLTPWMYEGTSLSPRSVDHLWIVSLPFDHPKHAILGRRSEHFGTHGFDHYFVPRMLQRLFRLVRAYCKHRKEDGDILLLDQRMKTKDYGKRTMEYLSGITTVD